MKKHLVGWVLASSLVLSLGGCGSSGDDSAASVASLSSVEQGKQSVAALRTWTTQLNALSTSGQSFDQELQIADSTGQAAATTSESLLIALAAMTDVYVNESSKITIAALSYSVDLASALPAGFTGTASGTIVGSGNRASITNGVINGDAVNAVVVFPTPNGTEFKLDIASAEVANLHAYTRVDTGSATVKYANNATNTRPQSLAFDLQVTVGEKDTLLNNQFTGHMIFDALNYWNVATEQRATNIGRMLLAGAFKNDHHSFSASFDVRMRNAGTFVGATPLQMGYQHNELATYRFSTDGHSVTIEAPSEKVTYTHNAATNLVSATGHWGSYSYSYLHYGTYTSLDNFLTTASLYEIQHTLVAGEGYYIVNMPTSWDVDGGKLDGTLAYPSYRAENVNMWRDIDATLRLEAEFKGLPGADIVLAVDRTAYSGLSASVIVAYNNVEIKLAGDGTLTNHDIFGNYYGAGHSPYGTAPQPGVTVNSAKLTVTVKTDGVTAKVVIEPDANNALVGSVTVNGAVVGTIKPDPKTRTILVTYIDGSFETVVF